MGLMLDLDGTSTDPGTGIERSLNYALDALGYRSLTAHEASRLVGPPLDWAFRQIVPDASDETVVALVAKYRERYGDVGYAENSMYPGIATALAALSADGVHMGVCTSKRVDFAERILEMFGLRRHLRFVNLRGMLRQGVVPLASTMIGDRAVDMEAARANALGAVGVLWGYGSEAELVAAAPDRVLTSPAELLTLAGHWL